jgi:NAD(P)-dependent dehydrogenase (short-subunit alcohol dehydrogenase family)
MKLELSGKLALVTGSTTGIGYACARGLASVGANVVINGRKPETVNAVVERIGKEFPKVKVTGVPVDLGNSQGVAHMLAAVPEVDILINNLAVASEKQLMEEADGEFMRLFELNFMSSLRLSRAYLPAMLKKNWGRIVFSGSISALSGTVSGAYPITKIAQLHLARSLAEYTRGTAVTVNTVMIGPTHSPSLDEMILNWAIKNNKAQTLAEAEKSYIKEVFHPLIGRFAYPEEVANLVVYLSTPLASATNGAIMNVDGGAQQAIL